MKQAHLLESLHSMGITHLNPMQVATAEAFGQHNNIVLLSPTGSGKTLGYLLPLLNALKPHTKHVQALVLVPSRELALQTEEVFKRLRSGFKVTCCYGGHDVKTEANNLIEPPALLIGTPGRILDHLSNERTDLGMTRLVVIDEFDKCLDMGFTDEMSEIMRFLPRIEQRMFTSATPIDELPLFMGVTELKTLNYIDNTPTEQRLQVKRIDSFLPDKLSTLLALVGKLGEQSMLIFLNHRESVERVAHYLSDNGVICDTFHGGREQNERERTIARFRNGSCRILVSTDLAARGLDIPAIDAVIHYHLPVNEEAYTHRNGRTARMNAVGTAYVIVGVDEILPDFIPDNLHYEPLPSENITPSHPNWVTLFIGKGKKDKVNKVDIVGFLCQQGHLTKENIGLIDVKDFFCYVAVSRALASQTIINLKGKKLKNKSVKIELAY